MLSVLDAFADDVVAVLWKQPLHLWHFFPCPCLLDAFARWFCSYTCISFLLDTLAGWFSSKHVYLSGVFPRRGLLARSFHSLPKNPWWDGCARCNGGWVCRMSFVSSNVCPPGLLNLMPWLSLLDMCVYIYIYVFSVSFCFPALFSLIHALSMVWLSPLGSTLAPLLHFCRLFCKLGTLDLYTLVNQVGSGKDSWQRASDVELCCITATFHVTQGADCPQFGSHSIFDAQRRLHLAPERSNGRILRLLQPAIPLTTKTREDWWLVPFQGGWLREGCV